MFCDIFLHFRLPCKWLNPHCSKLSVYYCHTPYWIIFENHISYISEVERDGKLEYIGEQEAQYILDKLKDSDVNEIIINSQDSRSVSSRLPIKIERFKQDENM
ncbi:hypothetical protein BKH46_08755 [Helicobacter sp. 12S02634-8]|nr:hypothetical protein BKH46_08755 [Helicobacter sp. 12S02634-8]